MTNLEFIRAKLPDFLVGDNVVASNLAVHDLDALSFVRDDKQKDLDLAYVDCLQYILRLPSSISQGGFSLSAVDKDFYRAEISAILNKYGLPSYDDATKPDITNAGSWL